ncbi:thioredoxin domain-containing protein [Euzebyella marina]|uniref:Thioredoxin domain-containing protein n=1 Tax=Euzebyella marina TaxID=1761453 RepID=A0A3G2L2X2_9FLAO|nr:thioredoxin domain-containing protein [Euzebyella marina]AYN66610.1 thioredoxin domain-containing protein [Euzebyella marina]
MSNTYTNALVHESSPYLQQHAHNPVNWVGWSEDILKLARESNKPLLISIGYAACHWCHVMEHECFEDPSVAEIMNSHFINIKVDREERPDIDHIYMDALQMMTGSGGWPLNIVALPDGRPFWGATYVKKNDWMEVLTQLASLYNSDKKRVVEYAQNMEDGIKAINLVELNNQKDLIDIDELSTSVKNWSKYFDLEMGGYNRAPKFMMPVNLNFLLHYATLQHDEAILDYVDVSLTKMAWGGVYDQVGGGFSRYSVDAKWHVPHFEKMLYDNGQLASLYAQAYAATGKELFKEVVEGIIEFVSKELTNQDFGFYSSLDADSLDKSGKLQEGAFYVWEKEELVQLLEDKFEIFASYFNINEYGYWEDKNYVLIRNRSFKQVALDHELSESQLQEIITESLSILKITRQKRPAPRLDDKVLTSWNGLMLKGIIDAYKYLGKGEYLSLALKNAQFILQHLTTTDGGLYHNHKDGKSSINGYLEDYASVIDAFTALYEVTLEETWIETAMKLTNHVISNFYDADNGMFYFTSKKDTYVIRRTVETYDNVIPSSNSIMAKNLFRLSRFFNEENFEKITHQQLKNVQNEIRRNAQSYANWMQLALYFNQPFYEIAITGSEVHEKLNELQRSYIPNALISGAEKKSNLPILKHRFESPDTLIYLCEKGQCQLPRSRSKEVLTQLRQSALH